MFIYNIIPISLMLNEIVINIITILFIYKLNRSINNNRILT